jgi:Holliday junction resolvasome RuvABC endonuclease subunit
MRRKPTPRILAIDPGTRHIGIAVLQGSDLVYHGVLTMPHRQALEAVRRNTRVLLRQLLSDFRPTVLVVEGNSIGSSRAKSRLHAVIGEIRIIGRRERVEVVMKSASTVKKFMTGSGQATKDEVARAVARSYPELKAYLRQTAKWRSRYHENMFDAVALALTVSGPPL